MFALALSRSRVHGEQRHPKIETLTCGEKTKGWGAAGGAVRGTGGRRKAPRTAAGFSSFHLESLPFA